MTCTHTYATSFNRYMDSPYALPHAALLQLVGQGCGGAAAEGEGRGQRWWLRGEERGDGTAVRERVGGAELVVLRQWWVRGIGGAGLGEGYETREGEREKNRMKIYGWVGVVAVLMMLEPGGGVGGGGSLWSHGRVST